MPVGLSNSETGAAMVGVSSDDHQDTSTPGNEPSVLATALAFLHADVSVVPIKADGSKEPTLRWKRLQSERMTEEACRGAFADSRLGVAVITGEVSGSLEALDFDTKEVFQEFVARCESAGLGDVLRRVMQGYWDSSPRGSISCTGAHR
jgi:putative DNA primase/helicase